METVRMWEQEVGRIGGCRGIRSKELGGVYDLQDCTNVKHGCCNVKAVAEREGGR